MIDYTQLDSPMSPPSVQGDWPESWLRVLHRLGAYTRTIVQAMNLRPSAVRFLPPTPAHILVRIFLPDHPDVVLRIAPEGHLAREVFFGRTMAQHHLPAARIIHHDHRRTLVPFDYLLERFVGGIPAAHLDAQPLLLRNLARQVGRTLRRMHRLPVTGWGGPVATGRWPSATWPEVLASLQQAFAPEPVAARLFDEALLTRFAALVSAPARQRIQPTLLHGALSLHTVRCTTGEHANLEALMDPGPVVGGDGLLDLAWVLTDPAAPQEWRTGLVEGYIAVSPLRPEEWERLQTLRVLVAFWKTCHAYQRGEPFQVLRDQAMALMAEGAEPPAPPRSQVEPG
jgi:hypothetical protein